MNVDQFKQLILTIVASVGGVGVIVGAVFAWLGKAWVDQIYLKTSAQYQKDLEELQNNAIEHRDLINLLLAVIANQRSKSYERILDSVELVWTKILEDRAFTQNLLFVYIILTPKEIETLTEKVLEIIPDTSANEWVESVNKIAHEVEEIRPFIGERLWELFSIYHAFVVRLAWKVIQGKTNQQFHTWDKDLNGEYDNFLMDKLKTIFSTEEINALVATPIPIVTIRKVLEVKILEEMNQMTLGSKFVERTIDDYIRFADISTTDLKNK